MHPQTVYAKTSKGVLEIKNKAVKLDRDSGNIFLSVDGKSTVAELGSKGLVVAAAASTSPAA